MTDLTIPQEGPSPRPLDWLRDYNREQTQAQQQHLREVFKAAVQSNPQIERRAHQIATKLGVPRERVLDNMDVAEEWMRERSLMDIKLSAENPELTRFLENVKTVRMLHDDAGNLKTTIDTFDWWSRNYEAGETQNELNLLYAKGALGELTPADRERIKEIETIQAFAAEEDGWFESGVQTLGQLLGPVLGATAIGGAAAGVASIGGPISSGTAFTYASGAAFFAHSAAVEFGSEYHEIYNTLVDDGMDPQAAHEKALVFAGAYGLGAGAIELLGFKIAGKPFKEAGKKVMNIVAQLGKKELTKKNVTAMIAEFVKGYAATVGSEVGEELGQGLLAASVEEVVAQLHGKNIERPTVEDFLGEMGSTMWEAFKGMSIIGVVGPAVNLSVDAFRIKQVGVEREMFRRLEKAKEKSKVAQDAPDTYAEMVSAAVQGKGPDAVYVDVADLEEALDQSGNSHEDFEADLPEVAAQLNAAKESGDSIAIPFGDYAARVVGTTLHDALKKKIRLREDGFSQEQAEAARAEMKQNAEATAKLVTEKVKQIATWEKEAAAVEQRIKQEVEATSKMSKPEASFIAQAYRSFVETQAARLDMTPTQFDEAHRLQFKEQREAGVDIGDAVPQAGKLTEKDFVMHPVDEQSGRVLVEVDPAKIDAELAKDKSMYVGPGGTGAAIEPRYQQFTDWLEGRDVKSPTGRKVRPGREPGEGIRAPTAHYIDGVFSLGDGRHRFSVLNDRGERVFMSMIPHEAEAARKAGLLRDGFEQANALRKGTETLKRFGLDPKKRHKTRQVAGALEARARKKYGGIDRDDRSVDAEKRIAKWMADEVQFSLDNADSGVGWYSTKYQQALDTLGELYPELLTDKSARDTMTAIIAITSDGQKPLDNLRMASELYASYRRNGTLKSKRSTNREVQGNLRALEQLLDERGPEAAHAYLMEEMTVADLNVERRKQGEKEFRDFQAHIVIPRAAAVFGPKLGSFYANLMGSHGYLTMDRWWSRTFNRYRGTLLPQISQRAYKRMRELLDNPNLSEDEIIEECMALRAKRERIAKANAVAKGSNKPVWLTPLEMLVGKQVKKNVEAWAAKAREKLAADGMSTAEIEELFREDALLRAGKNIADTFDTKINDAPFGSKDRTFMMAATERAVKMLKRRGVEISVADVQAVLWYYEKQLYTDLGAEATAKIAFDKAAEIVAAERSTKPDKTARVREATRGAGVDMDERGFEHGGMPGNVYRDLPVDTSYGVAQEGSSTVIGVHFSTQPRESLSGEFYGSGLRGQEADRVAGDKVASKRIHLYVDTGNGVRPEPGVGGHIHTVQLNNVYDVSVDPLGLTKEWRASGERDFTVLEKAAVAAGFDGVYVPRAQGEQGVVVLIGEKHTNVPVKLVKGETLAPTIVNIGTAMPDGSKPLSQRRITDALEAVGAKILKVGFHKSDTELTAVVQLQVPLTPAQAEQVSEALGQEAIAQHGPDGGGLFGPKAEAWGPFNPEFFIMPDGTRGSEAGLFAPSKGKGGPRGKFVPSSNTAWLLEEHDASTFWHEMSHFFLTTLMRMASMEGAPEPVVRDAMVLLKWFGVESIEAWNAMSLDEQRAHQEAFAYNSELYAYEQKAPTPELADLFSKLARWMRRVYGHVRDKLNAIYKREFKRDLPALTPEVRAVFDRMLASEEAIAAAQAERSMTALFDKQPEGVSDIEWANYLMLKDKATEDAIAGLTKSSLQNMRWLRNAKSAMLRAIQKQTRALRKEMEDEVRAALQSLPVYVARQALRSGKNFDGEPVQVGKLSTEQVRKILAEEFPDHSLSDLSGLTSPDGVHPVALFELFKFASWHQMIQALLTEPALDEAVQAETDRRMLEEHSELFDEKKIEARIDEVLHNEHRARMVATELRFLAKATTPVRVMVRAARAHAREVLGAMTFRQIQPHRHKQNEVRHRREADKALRKGEQIEATLAKRRELVESEKHRVALEIREEVDKALKAFRNFAKSDQRLAGNRDVRYIMVGRALLAAFGLMPGDRDAHAYVQQLQENDPEVFMQLAPMMERAKQWADDAAAQGRELKDWRDLTIEEFRDVRDLVLGLWRRSLREAQVVKDGKKVATEEVADEVVAHSLAENKSAKEAPKGDRTRWEKIGGKVKSLLWAAVRPENWFWRRDGAKVGPFTRYFWRPVRDAVNRYMTDRAAYTARVAAMVKRLHPHLKQGIIEFRDADGKLLHQFGRGNGGFGHAELVAALLHTGNKSNLMKLLIGRGWATWDKETETMDTTHWDAFVAEMVKKKFITKEVMDFVQEVWDLNEELKPLAQRAHFDTLGFYFREVEATPIEIPGVGTYRGGYMPAKLDHDARSASRLKSLADLERDFRQQFATTGRGFTKARSEMFAEPLLLDLDLVPGHIDDVLRFAHIQPVIKDVERLGRNAAVAAELERHSPGAWDKMILPWLHRVASQSATKPGMDPAIDMFFRNVRQASAVALMMGNIANAAQQFVGPVVAALRVKPRYLMNALWRTLSARKETYQNIADKSPGFMAPRQENQIYDSVEVINDLMQNKSKLRKAQGWVKRHAYFLQVATQNFVDAIVWQGAYEQAMANGGVEVDTDVLEKEAIQQADAAVRSTQGSFDPTDEAGYAAQTPFIKTFLMFSSWFNSMANLQADQLVAMGKATGFAKAGVAFQAYLLGFAVPMLGGSAITFALRGQLGDNDEDGDVWDDLLLDFFVMEQLRAGIAELPAIGPNVMAPILNQFDNQPWNDRMMTSPAVSVMERAFGGTIKAGFTAFDPEKDIKGRNIRDVMTLLGVLFGMPGSAIGKYAGYGYDVAEGTVEPTVRGAITGTAARSERND